MKLSKNEHNHIRNIIFDLGGVLLNINYKLTEEAFAKLGVSNFSEAYSQAKQSPLFDDIEVGKASPQDFRDGLRKYMNLSVSDQMLDEAWNAMLLDMPIHRVDLIKAAGANYRIFLLSNTNQIHFDAYSKHLSATHGFSSFSEIMEKQYLSFELGLRKPHRECFEAVLAENGLLAAETLFIDDSIQHIHGARATGLNAYHLLPGEDVSVLFA